MSSDWNEPGPTWQEPSHANWTQSPDLNPSQQMENDHPMHDQQGKYAFDPDAQNMLDTSFSAEQDFFPENQEMDEEEESDTVADSDPIAKSDSFLKQIWYYVTLIVFPLLFFGIASLLILPHMTASHGSLVFWFIAILLLIIAVGQGIAVYFSGQENYMWVPGTVGGLVLFVLVSVFLLTYPWVGIVLLLAVLAGSIYLARRCIHPVVEGFVDIMYVSGKYTRTLYPGFNLIWPWETVMHQVNIEETNWNCPPQKIQLSPEEDVILRAVISYQVAPEDAYLAVTRINKWEEHLRELFVTKLQTIATHFRPTDFMAWPQSLQGYREAQQHNPQSAHLPDEGVDDFSGGPARRESINTSLFEQMRDSLAPLGIQIHWVYIRDIELRPHTLARAPMRPDYIETINDNQSEQELVGVSSAAQRNGTQSADNGNAGESGKHVSVDQEITQVIKGKEDPNATQPLIPQNLPKEDTLRKAYEQIQSGKVTDPQAIRQMAMIFEAVDRDPEASEKITFDIKRAVANLYKQAEQYEEMYRSGQL